MANLVTFGKESIRLILAVANNLRRSNNYNGNGIRITMVMVIRILATTMIRIMVRIMLRIRALKHVTFVARLSTSRSIVQDSRSGVVRMVRILSHLSMSLS